MSGFEILGAVLSAAGTLAQASAASNQAKFEAKVAEQQAERERQIAARDAQDFERGESADLARSRALRAASGFELTSGTPLLVDRASNVEIELGKDTIKTGGDTRAIRFQQEADLQRMKGRNAKTAGFFKAGTTLLTGAANSKFG